MNIKIIWQEMIVTSFKVVSWNLSWID